MKTYSQPIYTNVYSFTFYKERLGSVANVEKMVCCVEEYSVCKETGKVSAGCVV